MRRSPFALPAAALCGLAAWGCAALGLPTPSSCGSPLNVFGCDGPDCDCVEATLSPGSDPQGLTGAGGTCKPADTDDACAVCVKEQCCAAGYACGADPVCHCYVAAAQDGLDDAAASAKCGDPGSLYTAAKACVTPHCHACPALP